MFEVIRESV